MPENESIDHTSAEEKTEGTVDEQPKELVESSEKAELMASASNRLRSEAAELRATTERVARSVDNPIVRKLASRELQDKAEQLDEMGEEVEERVQERLEIHEEVKAIPPQELEAAIERAEIQLQAIETRQDRNIGRKGAGAGEIRSKLLRDANNMNYKLLLLRSKRPDYSPFRTKPE
jgi:polyribonucleotide nucleotidyltransferase